MITQRGANLLLDVLTGRSYAQVSAYAGLSSTKPTTAGGNFTEPTAAEYARVLVGTYNGNVKAFSAANEGKAATTSIIYFPEARSQYPRLTYIGLFNSPSGTASTSLLHYAPILVPEYVRNSAEITDAATFDYDKANDRYTFTNAVSDAGGDYEFTYSGTNSSWQLNNSNVSLTTYGITLSADVTPTDGDTLTVHFGIVPANKTIPIVRVGAWTIQLY